jgi:hypothetical protein
MIKRIKLYMDWGSYPTWEVDDVGDFDPEDLPLSRETLDRLKAWQASFNSILNWDDPMSTPPTEPEVEEAFQQEGLSLWKQLRHELGSEYEVFYEYYNQLLKEPEQLIKIFNKKGYAVKNEIIESK